VPTIAAMKRIIKAHDGHWVNGNKVLEYLAGKLPEEQFAASFRKFILQTKPLAQTNVSRK
jgi:hypothetical protein